MNRRTFSLLVAALGLTGRAAAVEPLRVAATHPLLADLARQVGGAGVSVANLLRAGADAHHFEPTASDLAELRGSVVVFASGKHLENYLDKLADSLGSGVVIIEVGKTIPSLKFSPAAAAVEAREQKANGTDQDHLGGTDARGEIDPHWWHSATNMARACRIIGESLTNVDPAHADEYKAGAATTAKKMLGLKSWAEQQILQIPKPGRKLVTAHAAFGYFCKEYGFAFLPILGLSREDDFSPQFITAAIRTIRENQVRAVFPEDQANPKVMAEIVRETGVTIADTLIADGTAPGDGSTFEGMLRHNVGVIVGALKP